MTESKKHFEGKCAIEKIVLEDGWHLGIRDGEDKFPFLTSLGLREYYPDLMAWKDETGWVVFEVDGKKGHTTKTDNQKMMMRDEAFRMVDIRTVRIKTEDLVGRKKQPLDILLAEIDYQLRSV
jgi:hypothetical protein